MEPAQGLVAATSEPAVTSCRIGAPNADLLKLPTAEHAPPLLAYSLAANAARPHLFAAARLRDADD